MSHRIAVGIGNTSVQIALFDGLPTTGIPSPEWHETVAADTDFDNFHPSGEIPANAEWIVASVSRETESNIRHWVDQRWKLDDYCVLQRADFPIVLDVEYPDRVGQDRLAAAVAVAAACAAGEPAIFVDAGTAMTVNAIDDRGRFIGGAILPGTLISARALFTWTDQLPEISVDWRSQMQAPAVIGRSTETALTSGLYWSAVGAARELVQRMSTQLVGQPNVYVTGGFGYHLANHLEAATYVPHLVVAGIALSGANDTRPGSPAS